LLKNRPYNFPKKLAKCVNKWPYNFGITILAPFGGGGGAKMFCKGWGCPKFFEGLEGGGGEFIFGIFKIRSIPPCLVDTLWTLAYTVFIYQNSWKMGGYAHFSGICAKIACMCSLLLYPVSSHTSFAKRESIFSIFPRIFSNISILQTEGIYHFILSNNYSI